MPIGRRNLLFRDRKGARGLLRVIVQPGVVQGAGEIAQRAADITLAEMDDARDLVGEPSHIEVLVEEQRGTGYLRDERCRVSICEIK